VTRVLALTVILAGCYLPQADVARPIEAEVTVAVYRCTAELVAGEIVNSANVAIEVILKAKWLDNKSNVFHEVEVAPFVVPANGTAEWEGAADEAVANPALCQAETVSVTES
jgi:hypothetical protein